MGRTGEIAGARHPHPCRAAFLRAWAVSLLCACAWLQPFSARAQAAPTPFGACPIEAYQTINVGGTFGLYTINVGNGAVVLVGTDTELQNINAIGFNESDRFIYGWNQTTRQVVRVGQAGVSEFVGPTPAGLATYNSFVGDVVAGRLYLLSGSAVRVVDIAGNALVLSSTITGPTGIADWALNPVDGKFYGVQGNGTILRIDLATNTSTTVTGISVPATGTAFGAVYFDNQGSMYASRNDGSIFRVRGLGGGPLSVQTLTTAAPPTGQNDGARCPNSAPPVASVTVRKQLTAESGSLPGRAEANELLTYTFTLTNAGTLAASNYPFFEVLPANTTLVSLAGGSSDCSVGSAGARLCTITVPGPIAANNGTATATLVVRVANPIPAGVTRILNLATDDNGTPPAGCPGSNQPCTPPPSCSANTDPNHCVILPLPSADLAVTKTNNATSVVSGTQTTYDIVVSNAGQDAANNAVVRDPPPTGLTACTLGTPACTAAGGAVCPVVGNGAGQLSVANLQSAAGVAIPLLPAGGSVTLKLTCTAQ